MTLHQVLQDASAPYYVDYLSLDVEGHEAQVLAPSSNLFERYAFRAMAIERP